MLKVLLARLEQKHRTAAYPAFEPEMPDRFRGAPMLDPTKCPEGCQECIKACPTDAVIAKDGGLVLDMGRCLFCTECTSACPEGAIAFTRDYQLAARTRADLLVSTTFQARAKELGAKMLKLFGRSLKLRQVSAGGCNGCEADVNVLST